MTCGAPIWRKNRGIEEVRREATGKLDPKRRGALGQFMTPSAIADFMASMFRKWPEHIDLLDPGAGIGSLTEAFARKFLERCGSSRGLSVRAYEIEPVLVGYLAQQLAALRKAGAEAELVQRDFITEGAFALSFGGQPYSHAILNPPYKKIGASSEYRLLLRRCGIETVNLYTAFLGLAVALTKDGGEIVAIIPRSFCNGMYFRPFREWLLRKATIKHTFADTVLLRVQHIEVIFKSIILKRQGFGIDNVCDKPPPFLFRGKPFCYRVPAHRHEPFQRVYIDTQSVRLLMLPRPAKCALSKMMGQIRAWLRSILRGRPSRASCLRSLPNG
jgi:Eco57I restriction-modification methylase